MDTTSQACPSASTPLAQPLGAWWADARVELSEALDGVPVVVLMDFCLLGQQRGQPAAQQDLQFLLALVERWLRRFEADIAAFPDQAVPVLQRQKAQLQATRAALSQLQQALLSITQTAAPGTPPASADGYARADAGRRYRAAWPTWVQRRRPSSHRQAV